MAMSCSTPPTTCRHCVRPPCRVDVGASRPEADMGAEYYLRAYAWRPNSPVVVLTIGLAYLHYATKRQVYNRQFVILQALSFLGKYRDMAQTSASVGARMAADYNLGRAYQFLGLQHLALPKYSNVLAWP